MQHKILIVDDDAQVRKMLTVALSAYNYITCQVATGNAAIDAIRKLNPDLVLLDLDLPDMAGRDVLRKVRGSFKNPIIVISVHDDKNDIVEALQAGADDFITKPFRTHRLISSISSLLDARFSKRATIIGAGRLSIDIERHMVKNGDRQVSLTADEQKLLELLSQHSGRIFTESYLAGQMRAGAQDKSLFIKKLVSSLRLKIEPDANHPRFIISEPGVGYRFVA